MNLLILALSLIAAKSAMAGEADSFVIRQILLGRNRAVVAFKTELSVGSDLLATLKDGSQCVLRVTAVKDKVANVDTSQCSSASTLVVGQKLEPSIAVDEPEQVITSPNTMQVESQIAQPIPQPQFKAQAPREIYRATLTDLQYFPSQGQVTVGLNYLNARANTSGSYQGLTLLDEKDTINEVDTYIGGGINDQLAFGLKVGYLANRATQHSFGPASTIVGQERGYQSAGMRDPSVSLVYRILDQNSSSLLMDLTFEYSPKSNDSKSATTTTKGNGVRGGDYSTVKFGMGKKRSRGSNAFEVNAGFFGSSSAKDPDTDVQSKETAHSVVSVGVSGQIRAGRQVYFRGNLTERGYSSSTYSTPGSSDQNLAAYNQASIGLGLVVDFIPQAFAGLIMVQRNLSASSSYKVASAEISGTTEGTDITVSTMAES